MTTEQKAKFLADAFMKDDPKEYEGETLEEVTAQLMSCGEPGVNRMYDFWFDEVQKLNHSSGIGVVE